MLGCKLDDQLFYQDFCPLFSDDLMQYKTEKTYFGLRSQKSEICPWGSKFSSNCQNNVGDVYRGTYSVIKVAKRSRLNFTKNHDFHIL